MKKKIDYLVLLFTSFLVVSALSSCLSSKRLTYFNEVTRDSVAMIESPASQTTINKNDILQITVTSLDAQANSIYNGSTPDNASSAKGSPDLLNGYLVDESGTVKFPLLGRIKAEGLDKNALADTITHLLISKKIALDPLVNVRIINYKITVLGEVNHPGVIPIPNEKITLPEAIGFAGDLTPYGKRNNILLIREKDGKRIFKRFSLNDKKIFDRDFYYLQNKDVIYVEPANSKAITTNATIQFIPIALSALSLLVLYLTYTKK